MGTRDERERLGRIERIVDGDGSSRNPGLKGDVLMVMDHLYNPRDGLIREVRRMRESQVRIAAALGMVYGASKIGGLMLENSALRAGAVGVNQPQMEILTNFIQQVVGSPGGVIVILLLSILCFRLEQIPQFPNKLNWMLPFLLLILGTLLFPVFTSVESVPKVFPNPKAYLWACGFICATVASAAHMTLLRFLINKYSGGDDKSGLTGQAVDPAAKPPLDRDPRNQP